MEGAPASWSTMQYRYKITGASPACKLATGLKDTDYQCHTRSGRLQHQEPKGALVSTASVLLPSDVPSVHRARGSYSLRDRHS